MQWKWKSQQTQTWPISYRILSTCLQKMCSTKHIVLYSTSSSKRLASSSSSSASIKEVCLFVEETIHIMVADCNPFAVPSCASFGQLLHIIMRVSKFDNPNVHLHKLFNKIAMKKIHSHSYLISDDVHKLFCQEVDVRNSIAILLLPKQRLFAVLHSQ